MRKIIYAFSCLIAALMMVSCQDSTGTQKVSATGTIYELLVVADKPEWNGGCGDSIRAYLGADMPCMPQMESYFNLMQVDMNLFDASLKATRNILILDINKNRYTQPKLHARTDVYSHPQAVVTITAPTVPDMEKFLGENGQKIQDWFVRQELMRQAAFYKQSYNQDADALLQKKFGVSMKIPSDYMLIQEDEDFVWFCNNAGPKRRDIVVYAYPFRDKNTFTCEYLTAKRDSVMKRVGSSIEGSYMGTEYKYFPPQLRKISRNNAFCVELRGLWKMLGGGAMGGPFVQHTRVDEVNQRVITAEAFVFAAGQKKRNVYRQNEAILYTLTLPQDVNNYDDITITPDASADEE